MEPEAVIQAKESDLKYLGIEKMGDILPLKTFGGNCIKQNEKHNIINEMKRKLLPFVSMNIEREKKWPLQSLLDIKRESKLRRHDQFQLDGCITPVWKNDISLWDLQEMKVQGL